MVVKSLFQAIRDEKLTVDFFQPITSDGTSVWSHENP